MKILDRYILKEFLLPFIWCLFVFISLYIVIDLFVNLDDIIKNSISFAVLIDYYMLFAPTIFAQTSPIAVLVSCVYALMKLAGHNEIMAMRSGGIAIRRIVFPIAVSGAIISGLVFFVNEELIPRNANALNRIKENIRLSGATPRTGLLTDIALYGKYGRLYYIGLLNPRTYSIKDITILEHDKNQNLTAKIFAKSGLWVKDLNSWVFYEGAISRLMGQGEPLGEPEIFKERVMDIAERPDDFLKSESKLEYMRYKKLKEYIRQLGGERNRLRNRLRIELYNKVAFPWMSFIMVIIGIACVLKKRYSSIWGGFGISLAIGFLYYAVMSISVALGKSGTIHPLISVWFANAAFAGMALLTIWRSR